MLNCASVATHIHPAPILSHSKQSAASWKTKIEPYTEKLILNLEVLKVRKNSEQPDMLRSIAEVLN